MRILAIETATIEVGVAVADETGLLATLTARPGRRQAETLHPAIAEVCRTAGVALCDMDAIAVDIGPGLFTGLRVGIAAAKALAGGLGIPIVSATSLEILVSACPGAFASVVPVIDMRRSEVAWVMPNSPPGSFRVASPALLADDLAGLARPVLLVGDGALRHRDLLAARAVPGTVFGGTELAAAPVASLVVLAMEAMSLGRQGDPADVRPLYGREADARINWSSREARQAVGR
jgi:tRNA threonylcarbamoyladenosine biosynthesis protein TsaB